MTIKELKHNILISLYHRYKDNKPTSIGLTELCTQEKLVYDSLRQLSDAAKGLKEDGYINITFFIGGDGYISGLTPNGVEYIEENLLSQEDQIIDGLSDTDKMMKSGADIQIDIPEDNNTEEASPSDLESDSNENFRANETYKPIVDADATPCFGVDSIADCYAKQLDEIALSKIGVTRMLGIFGPWGRGKTYFFKRLKRDLEDKERHTLTYKIVEFNAWKYQETPAIWAYLYETIYKSADWCEKGRFLLKQIWRNLFTMNCMLYVVILALGWLIGGLISLLSSDSVSHFLNYLKIPATGIYVFTCIASYLNKNVITGEKIIKSYTKIKSYKTHLGIQNIIEDDMQMLIRSITDSSSRLVLFIDDVDRCSSQKMNYLIESLRTVLENPKIQERLIVICSVDDQKLMKAYSNDLLSKRYNEDEVKKLAREQMDKLFLFGVKLAPLDTTQLTIYLQSLMDDSNKKEPKSKENGNLQINTPFNTFRHNDSLIQATTSDEITELNNKKIKELIHEFLINHKGIDFTPRKIRIMYYQLLFGLSLSSKGGGAFTDTIVEAMLRKSAGIANVEDTESAMSDIIEMAVPY